MDFLSWHACQHGKLLAAMQLRRENFFEDLQAACRQHFTRFFPMFHAVYELRHNFAQAA